MDQQQQQQPQQQQQQQQPLTTSSFSPSPISFSTAGSFQNFALNSPQQQQFHAYSPHIPNQQQLHHSPIPQAQINNNTLSSSSPIQSINLQGGPSTSNTPNSNQNQQPQLMQQNHSISNSNTAASTPSASSIPSPLQNGPNSPLLNTSIQNSPFLQNNNLQQSQQQQPQLNIRSREELQIYLMVCFYFFIH